MKRTLVGFACWIFVLNGFGQTVGEKLQKAFQQFEADSQMRHGISSLYVIDANTGEVIFGKNEQMGFAPASTQKIITAVTAFELLGKDFRYKTDVGYRGTIEKNTINGNIFVKGAGDPTLGSWRWKSTSTEEILDRIGESIKKLKVTFILGEYVQEVGNWEAQEFPDGWIWQDVGNYYGAGARKTNWRENQYDVFLDSGRNIGDSVKIIRTEPDFLLENRLTSELKSAQKGTGDNAYIYLPLGYNVGTIRGTIPVDEHNFKISGSMLDPGSEFLLSISRKLDSTGISSYSGKYASYEFNKISNVLNDSATHVVYSHYSPSLDSIIYWFLKKSINLYGEALVKTFSFEQKGFGATDSGLSIVRKFWKERGIDRDELNIYDGSGLSPLNRVTPHAQVEILKYAKTRDWFQYFYNALPIFNEMHMKSGTISDVKGFCGYHTSKEGREYIFSFLVNNYGGRTGGIVNKMYKVLDELK